MNGSHNDRAFQLLPLRVQKGHLLGTSLPHPSSTHNLFINVWCIFTLKFTPSIFFCPLVSRLVQPYSFRPPSLLLSPVSWVHLAAATAAPNPTHPIPTTFPEPSYQNLGWWLKSSWSHYPCWQDHEKWFPCIAAKKLDPTGWSERFLTNQQKISLFSAWGDQILKCKQYFHNKFDRALVKLILTRSWQKISAVQMNAMWKPRHFSQQTSGKPIISHWAQRRLKWNAQVKWCITSRL